MAKSSFYHNVCIKDEASARRFIEAVNKSEEKKKNNKYEKVNEVSDDAKEAIRKMVMSLE